MKINYTPREPDPLPKGKVNVVWRQSRCGYVVTVGGKDLLGVDPQHTEIKAIENVLDSGYCDEGGRLVELKLKLEKALG